MCECTGDPGSSTDKPVVSSSSLEDRRSFLGALLGVGSVFVGGLLSVPLIRLVLHPLLRSTTPVAWSGIGTVDELVSINTPTRKNILIEQRDGWRKVVSEKAVYVIKNAGGQLAVLSSVCPHLGCSVPWVAEKNEFVCPCHIGRFAPDGKLLGGPPPRGMDHLESCVENGVLQVHHQYFRQLVPFKEVIG